MTASAPRSVEEYLRQLRAALEGQDPALIQDALYDAEEYLRAELSAHPGKSEADVLELIASTYGAPDEVAAAYRDTELKVAAALRPPTKAAASGRIARFFGVYSDPRAYAGLLFMFFSLATGLLYFTVTITGIALSFGLAFLIVGIPFFLVFIGITRVLSLVECRLVEAVSGVRMPRRPVHPGAARGFWARIVDMLKDARTWTTLAYNVLMLPVGITYFTVMFTGLVIGLAFTAAPVYELLHAVGLVDDGGLGLHGVHIHDGTGLVDRLESPAGLALMFIVGVLLTTFMLNLARAVTRGHATIAKALLVLP